MLDYFIKKLYIVYRTTLINYKVFLIWLFFVIVWNYGFPNVPPISDVIVAVLLTLMSKYLNIKVRKNKNDIIIESSTNIR
jgi:hypothetical protein